MTLQLRTNSVDSETSAEFVSDTLDSEDLHLDPAATSIGNGADLTTSPTGVQFDIDGFDRHTEAVTWDSGADQFVAVVSSLPLGSLALLGVGI